MKIRLLLLMLFTSELLNSQSGTVEHYYYISKQQMPSAVPMAHYTSSKNWYGEMRYNYENINTLSIYGGKTFSKEGAWSYTATPVVGAMMGQMEGGAVGANVDVNYGKLFLSTQSQYAFSTKDKSNKYFFNWSELGYDVLPWLYGGIAVQQTNIYHQNGLLETGCTIGFSIKNWTVPLYIFNPFAQDNLVIVGINWEWQNSSKDKQPIHDSY